MEKIELIWNRNSGSKHVTDENRFLPKQQQISVKFDFLVGLLVMPIVSFICYL